ncbi:hypothetical protein ACFL5V_04480 [Fibrobacterota bacterium]
MEQGKPVKGQFIWRTGEDRRRVVEAIKAKIDAGFFHSETVINELVEKLGPQFASTLEE